MNTSIFRDNETLVSMGLAKTVESPRFPSSGTLPMITVPRMAFPRPARKDVRERRREPRPPMPVLLDPRPSMPSVSTVVVTRSPRMLPRVAAALFGFVLALVATSVAMRTPCSGSAAQASVIR